MLDRRQVLGLLGAAGSLAALGLPLGAGAATSGPPRLVVVLLRGGLDGVHAVVPHGDPAYTSARGALALAPSDVLDLDGTFGLHPSLSPIHPWFSAGELLPLHALGLPYQERSHFDAQEVLDTGARAPGAARDGWLNRAIAALPGAAAISVGPTVPLVLRGPAPIFSVNPQRTRGAHDSLLDALEGLYASDPALAGALAAGRQSLALLPDDRVAGGGRDLGARAVHAMASATLHPEGPTAVVVEVGGWDTHAQQGGARGQLANRLGALAEGLVGLRAELGAAWDRTVVFVLTEFGRTISANGTGGTDHGVGSAGLLLGGAVAGGRVLADWPGLARRQLLAGRDLRPTQDVRGIIGGILRDHLRLDGAGWRAALPGLDERAAVDGLIRGG